MIGHGPPDCGQSLPAYRQCLPAITQNLQAPVRCPIIVMAKAPLPGLVKTRLIPALGPQGAAVLAERLLRHAVEQALAAGIGAVELCVAPDLSHPCVVELARGSQRLSLELQGQGDIGQRMARALQRHLLIEPRVLLIGTDLPGIDCAMLRQAAAALQTHDAVFVPALDGGYGLVGLRRWLPELFEGIAWSSAAVMAQTRQRLAAASMSHLELEPQADIDLPADLVHLPTGWLT